MSQAEVFQWEGWIFILKNVPDIRKKIMLIQSFLKHQVTCKVKEGVVQIFHRARAACHQVCSFLGGRIGSWTKEMFSKGHQSDFLHHNNILTQVEVWVMVPAWRNSLGVSAHQCQAGQPSPRGAGVVSTDSAAFRGVYKSVRNVQNIGELELKGSAFLYSGLHLRIFNFRVPLMWL